MKTVALKFGQTEPAFAPALLSAPAIREEANGVLVASEDSIETPEVDRLGLAFTAGGQILSELMELSSAEGFSDLQIQSGRLIYCNGGGRTRPFEKWGILNPDIVFNILRILYESRRIFLGIKTENEDASVPWEELFLQQRRLDFASEGSGPDHPLKGGRVRVQAFFSNQGIGITVRVLRNKIASLEQIGMPAQVTESLRQRVTKKQGIGLIVGPTGSGKTTTLAALLDWVRRNLNKHIVTIEDPIEYVYPDTVEQRTGPAPAPALVTQQEVGAHVKSFEQGLVDALRKKPDIILVGEIRTAETLRIALEAAETGHFILSTLHTRGAGKTLGRMRQMFNLEQARGILQQFADVGSFILSQGLMPDIGGKYLLCCELFVIQEIEDRNAIRKYAEGGFQDVEERLNKPYNRKWNNELRALLNAKRITPEVYEQFYQVTGLENK
ncbi:MAG: Flp pilus assembly complex ATPase component TadA [Verrucomicrobia bacterium]|nr:Flp pilus assembly complex ATPase component TadA [Verrucomicrobiota bacterium]